MQLCLLAHVGIANPTPAVHVGREIVNPPPALGAQIAQL